MARLIFLCVAAIIAWCGFRMIRREIARVGAKLRKAEGERDKKAEVRPLERDKDGVYRLKDD